MSPVQPTPTDISFRTISSSGLLLSCATAGPEGGPLVVLLHGFPARWSTWREPMTKLAAAGFFVVAPDLRGYGKSAKPSGPAHYSVERYVDDVVAIINGVGRERALVCGHDVGGGIAWCTAMMHPARVQRLAILNSVHPVGFERAMRRWAQLKKSWYIFFFQMPWLPEWILSRNDYAFLQKSLEADGLTPETTHDLLEGVKAAGALEAALDSYRQMFRDGLKKRPEVKKVEHPVLVIWGDRESHLLPELADAPPDWAPNARTVHIPEGSHWVQHDAPDRVSELLIEHFRAALS